MMQLKSGSPPKRDPRSTRRRSARPVEMIQDLLEAAPAPVTQPVSAESPPVVSFGHHHDALKGFDPTLRRLIETHGLKRVCEVGGGANPSLPLEYLSEHDLDYTLLDISRSELDKAPPCYRKVEADICGDGFEWSSGQYDLVFSKMLAEHVPCGATFHRNVHELLVPGGIAFHFLPTLYSLPFLINRLIPEFVSSFLLDHIAPRDREKYDKFPALYSWCRGPTRRQMKRLEALGFQTLEYTGFFGHDYYRYLPLVRSGHGWFIQMQLRYPRPSLTSYAFIILRKDC